MQTNIRDSLLRERLMAALSGFFGALATLLAMMGLFGVTLSNFVARRTGEIGLPHGSWGRNGETFWVWCWAKPVPCW